MIQGPPARLYRPIRRAAPGLFLLVASALVGAAVLTSATL